MTDTEFTALIEDGKMELTYVSEEYPTDRRQSISNEHALEKAAKMGLVVVFPDANTLTIDIDSSVIPTQYVTGLDLLKQFYTVEEETIKPSKSGNLHVYLRMKETFTEAEKIALQAALGSDPKRELLGLVRAKEGLGVASLMFEKPPAVHVEDASLSALEECVF